jgi:hypothetical protein
MVSWAGCIVSPKFGSLFYFSNCVNLIADFSSLPSLNLLTTSADTDRESCWLLGRQWIFLLIGVEANLFSGGRSEYYYYPSMFISGIILHITAFSVNAVLYHVQFF